MQLKKWSLLLLMQCSLLATGLATQGCGSGGGQQEAPAPTSKTVVWSASDPVDLEMLYTKSTGKTIQGGEWKIISAPSGDFDTSIEKDIITGKAMLQGAGLGEYTLNVVTDAANNPKGEEVKVQTVDVLRPNFSYQYIEYSMLDLSTQNESLVFQDQNDYRFVGVDDAGKYAVFSFSGNLVRVDLQTLQKQEIGQGQTVFMKSNIFYYLSSNRKLIRVDLNTMASNEIYTLAGFNPIAAFHENGPRFFYLENNTLHFVDVATPANNRDLIDGVFFAPLFSPNGNSVTFTHPNTNYYFCATESNDLYVMNVGSDPVKIANDLLGLNAIGISDGNGRVLYYKKTDANSCSVFSRKLDGTDEFSIPVMPFSIQNYSYSGGYGFYRQQIFTEGDDYILASSGLKKAPIRSGLSEVVLDAEPVQMVYKVISNTHYLYKNQNQWKKVAKTGGPVTDVATLPNNSYIPLGDTGTRWLNSIYNGISGSFQNYLIFDGIKTVNLSLPLDSGKQLLTYNSESIINDQAFLKVQELNDHQALVNRYYTVALNDFSKKELIWEVPEGVSDESFDITNQSFKYRKGTQWTLYDVVNKQEIPLAKTSGIYTATSPDTNYFLFQTGEGTHSGESRYLIFQRNTNASSAAEGSDFRFTQDSRYLIYTNNTQFKIRDLVGGSSSEVSVANSNPNASHNHYALSTQGNYAINGDSIDFMSFKTAIPQPWLKISDLPHDGSEKMLIYLSQKRNALYFLLGSSIYMAPLNDPSKVLKLADLKGKYQSLLKVSEAYGKLYLQVKMTDPNYEIEEISMDTSVVPQTIYQGKMISNCGSYIPCTLYGASVLTDNDKLLVLIPGPTSKVVSLPREETMKKYLNISLSGHGFYQTSDVDREGAIQFQPFQQDGLGSLLDLLKPDSMTTVLGVM